MSQKRVPCPNSDCEDGSVLVQSRGPYHPTASQPRWESDVCGVCGGEGMVAIDDEEDGHVDLGGEA